MNVFKAVVVYYAVTTTICILYTVCTYTCSIPPIWKIFESCSTALACLSICPGALNLELLVVWILHSHVHADGVLIMGVTTKLKHTIILYM